MSTQKIISGFSKLTKVQKLEAVSELFSDKKQFVDELKTFWHPEESKQKLFDEFSENTISNFYFPYGVVPNFMLNGKIYTLPMVIEESSVVAAAAKSAKFWLDKGGFKAEIIGIEKIGQVHFIYNGNPKPLFDNFEDIKKELIEGTTHITANMVKRGGGILNIELVDMTEFEEGYFQLKATFDTCDSMGANFINSCLEEFASLLKEFITNSEKFEEKDIHIIMSILSNYTPNCLVKCWVECPIEELNISEEGMTPEVFAWKFSKAVKVAQVDEHRATTHNKGIFNGIDSIILATGNDFRAVEACGHTYAAKDGKYTSLTDISLENGIFKYTLTIPMALGVVGGLTALHPLAKRSIEMLGYPSAKELMMIAAAAGMANNFGALKSLTTSGIQKGHMKMHLINILNHFEATEEEKNAAIEYFKTHKVSFNSVRSFLVIQRENINNLKNNPEIVK